MSHVLVLAKVKDFAQWSAVFSSPPAKAAREAAGGKSSRIFRPKEDPGLVVVLTEWDTLANARKFYASDQLRASQAAAGVIGTPPVYYLNEA